jgi:hypothetical protein
MKKYNCIYKCSNILTHLITFHVPLSLIHPSSLPWLQKYIPATKINVYILYYKAVLWIIK